MTHTYTYPEKVIIKIFTFYHPKKYGEKNIKKRGDRDSYASFVITLHMILLMSSLLIHLS